jgi:hypothetical protein
MRKTLSLRPFSVSWFFVRLRIRSFVHFHVYLSDAICGTQKAAMAVENELGATFLGSLIDMFCEYLSDHPQAMEGHVYVPLLY